MVILARARDWDIIMEAPVPRVSPMVVNINTSGHVIATAARPSSPALRPINIVSIILYEPIISMPIKYLVKSLVFLFSRLFMILSSKVQKIRVGLDTS